MPGSIRDDELALGRCEIPIGDINSDALLSLGPQTISQERQIDMLIASFAGTLLNRLKLILKDRF